MAINLTKAQVVYATMINNFSKTLTYTPVTKITSNANGDEKLSDGETSSITGAFFREEDSIAQNKDGLFQGADAILMVLPSVTINKNDKITYDGETYRVEKNPTMRKYADTDIYLVARLYKI